MSWKWPKVERTYLARLVMDDATGWLTDPRLDVNWNDLHGSPDARRQLVRALYRTLVGYRVNYVPEKYSPKKEVQDVRTPDEILDRPREGTCLDLSLLFCGLCLGCELVPWLVILQGHAFVLVSLAHRLRKYNDRSRPEWKLFLEGPLSDAAPLRQGIERGTYLALECTGFARSASLGDHLPEGRGRDADGLLSFEAAVEAGRAQLDYEPRPFEFAIDLPVARYEWGIEADDLPSPRQAVRSARPAAPEREPGILPYLVDRIYQTQAVRDSVLDPPKDRRARPAVFLIEGYLDQAHGGLIQRLRDYDLPEWLALRAEEAGIEEVVVQLPRPGAGGFDQSWRRELGLQLNLRSGGDPTWTDLARWLGDRRVSPIFSTTFNTSHWDEDGAVRIEAILRAWEACPDLPPGRAPLVCVKVVFEGRTASRVARWLGWDANSQLAGYLDRLARRLVAGKDFPRVQAVRLDRLGDVRVVNLIDWQNLKPVRQFLGKGDFTKTMQELFSEAAGAEPREGLPMGQVIPQLDRWLRQSVPGV